MSSLYRGSIPINTFRRQKGMKMYKVIDKNKNNNNKKKWKYIYFNIDVDSWTSIYGKTCFKAQILNFKYDIM